MKQYYLAIALLFAFAACTTDDYENGESGGNKNNPEELTVTGDAFDITDNSAKFTGYANLPFELGDAEVGIMYDKSHSFENAKLIVPSEFDDNNMFTVTATSLEASTKYYYRSFVQNGRVKKYGAVKSFTTLAQRVTSITLDKTSLSLEIGAEATLSVASVQPDNANDKSYTWSSSDNAIASVDNSGKVTAKAKGKATIIATANDGNGVSDSCSVDVCRIDIPQAVDMGTVVNGKNIKWASFNIGASSPEEYGLYYAWGETEPKSDYSWATYKFRTSGDSYDNVKFSKYNTKSSYAPVDNQTILDPEDDVAQVRLGGHWRMPTDAEWTELREQCTWTLVTNYNGSGINGRQVTATNGNSIFFPIAGVRGATGLYHAGSEGFCWSSSLYTEDPIDARVAFFRSGGFGPGHGGRCLGLSVRPVSE